VRHVLPLAIPLSAVWLRGLCRWRRDAEAMVCEIGDRADATKPTVVRS
jgi:hypothetical protein